MPKNVGARGSVVTGTSRVPVKDRTETYADLGLSKKTAAVAQQLASLPAPTRDAIAKQETALAQALVPFVISLNLHRRHLDESQRAMVAAKLATLKDGQRQVGQFADVPTQSAAAELLNVSDRTVRSAREVLDKGAPELVQAVERGDVAVSAAADVAELPKDEQREIVARG